MNDCSQFITMTFLSAAENNKTVLSHTLSCVCVLLRSSENPEPRRRHRGHPGVASMSPVSQVPLSGVTGPGYCLCILQAALLHDTVEDTDTSPQELEENFGPVVAGIVQEVTDDKSLPKQERKRQQVEHAPHCSHQAKLVKLADKLYNLRDLNRCTPVGQHLSLSQPLKLEHFPLKYCKSVGNTEEPELNSKICPLLCVFGRLDS